MFCHIVATAILLFVAVAALPSYADVAGPATVVDGDTIVVGGEQVRLQGIDAPELHQTCTAYGQAWACGQTAAEWLKNRLHGHCSLLPEAPMNSYGWLILFPRSANALGDTSCNQNARSSRS